MRLSQQDREDLDEMIRIMEELRDMRGARQVIRFGELAKIFADATAKQPLFGGVAMFFTMIADKDQSDRDEVLDAFIGTLRDGRN
jgi:hypothetical protein